MPSNPSPSFAEPHSSHTRFRGILRRTVPLFVCLLVIAGLVGGCKRKELPKSTPDNEVVRDMKFKKLVRDFTRHKDLIRGWNTTLDVWAVYEGWEYKKTLLNYRSSAYHWDEETLAEKSAAFEKDFDQNVSFVVAVFASEKEWIELDADEPAWVPFLVSEDGKKHRPIAVVEHTVPEDEQLMGYPFLDRWQNVYRIVYRRRGEDGRMLFPKDAAKVELLFSGSMGSTTLQWNFM